MVFRLVRNRGQREEKTRDPDPDNIVFHAVEIGGAVLVFVTALRARRGSKQQEIAA